MELVAQLQAAYDALGALIPAKKAELQALFSKEVRHCIVPPCIALVCSLSIVVMCIALVCICLSIVELNLESSMVLAVLPLSDFFPALILLMNALGVHCSKIARPPAWLTPLPQWTSQLGIARFSNIFYDFEVQPSKILDS